MLKTDKNGKEIKTGDIVKIEGGYFKADNGTFLVKHSPGDPSWSGSDYSLKKCNKKGKESQSKYSTAFWPLMVTVNSRDKRIEAKQHNAEHATIEVIGAVKVYDLNVKQRRGWNDYEYREIATEERYNELLTYNYTEIEILSESINEQKAEMPAPILEEATEEVKESTIYVYTEKAENRAKELGLEERKAGSPATCGYDPVRGMTAKAWKEKGYIEEKTIQTAKAASPINESLAKRNKENMSFSDYKTGSATAEYNAMIAEVREAIETAKAKVSEEAQEKLDRLLESYKRRLANWINKRNANGAGHVSVMIAGPSNYNMKKHNKFLAREEKLWQEYDDIKNINARIQAIVTGDKIIKSNDLEAIDKLKEKLEKALEEHAGYKEYNKIARKEGKDPLPAYVLSNSNGRIKGIRDRIKRLEAIAGQEPEEKEVNGIRIVDNPEAHRLQMFFDGKPDKPTRQLLKSNGFRWTPSIEAWQCYRSPGAMAKAEKLAEAASY